MKFSERILDALTDCQWPYETKITCGVRYLGNQQYQVHCFVTGGKWVIDGDWARDAYDEAGEVGLKYFLKGAITTEVG